MNILRLCFLSLVVAIAAISPGCSRPSSTTDTDADPAVAAAPNAGSLENQDWQPVELNGSAITPAESMPRPSIHFDSAEQVAGGSSGVNQYSGSYSLGENGAVELGPVRTTMMAGPPEAMQLENDYMAALAAFTRWRIEGGSLEFLDGDRVVARFEVNPPANRNGARP